jgi:hypothetical protein
MIVDPVSLLLISDAVAQVIFKEILKNRSADFRELLSALGRDGDEQEKRRQVEDAVTKLKELDLIKERTAPIKDFNSYYVTSGGLSAERTLKLIDSA